MDTTTRAGTPLRQRMLDDMRMRKLEPKTQEAYIRAVRKLGAHLKRSPETATVEDLRNFQLHLVDTGTSPITLNATLTGLKFFFDVTLGHIELMAKMQPVKVPRTLPVVLSPEEVSRLIAAARNVYSVISERLEEGEHPVVGLESAPAGLLGFDLVEGGLLDLEVGVEIDLRRLDRLVPQQQGNRDRLSPAWSSSIAVVWRSTCGVTCLFSSDGQDRQACSTCLVNR